MNLSFDIQYRVEADGPMPVVQITIKTQFAVPSENPVKHAEDVVVEIGRGLSGKDEGFVRERLQEQFWLNEVERPEEPST